MAYRLEVWSRVFTRSCALGALYLIANVCAVLRPLPSCACSASDSATKSMCPHAGRLAPKVRTDAGNVEVGFDYESGGRGLESFRRANNCLVVSVAYLESICSPPHSDSRMTRNPSTASRAPTFISSETSAKCFEGHLPGRMECTARWISVGRSAAVVSGANRGPAYRSGYHSELHPGGFLLPSATV
jgi:hypothetical protein